MQIISVDEWKNGLYWMTMKVEVPNPSAAVCIAKHEETLQLRPNASDTEIRVT